MKQNEIIGVFLLFIGCSSNDSLKKTNYSSNPILDLEYTISKKENQKCQIKDFGTFKVKRRAPRKGVSLKTGKAIKIPSRLAMTFKMSS